LFYEAAVLQREGDTSAKSLYMILGDRDHLELAVA
jgi:hypothetical protein